MNERRTRWLGFILLFVVFIVAIIVVYFGMKYLALAWAPVSKESKTLIVTALFAVLTVVIGKIYDSKLQAQAKQREKKAEFYGSFTDLLFEILANTHKKASHDDNGENTTTDQQEFVQKLWSLMSQGVVWASNDFIKIWVELRQQIPNTIQTDKPSPTDPTKMMKILSSLLLIIRKDLGYRKSTLKNSEILSVFINDIYKNGMNKLIDE